MDGLGFYNNSGMFDVTVLQYPDINTGLIAKYSFEDGAADLSGNGNDGLLLGPVPSAGWIGNALLFNGVSDYVLIPDSNILDIGTSDFTIATWVKLANTQRFNALIEKRGVQGIPMSSLSGYNFAVYPPGKLSFALRDSTNNNPWGNGQTTLSPNQWYHVAVVVDRDASATFFVDGIADGGFGIAGAQGSLAGPGDLLLGKRENYVWDDMYLYGAMDEVRIYNRALTASQIAELAAEGLQEVEADAGPDQSVPENTMVILDGAGSTGDNLSFHWTQLAGPTVVLDLSNPAYPTFTTPTVPMGGVILTFELQVSNSTGNSATDIVDITVTNVNHKPVADAGDNQLVSESVVVTLDGSNSFDEDNESLTCTWSQTSGVSVAINDPNACVTNFTTPTLVPVAGTELAFRLIVSDGIAVSDPDTMTVWVSHANLPPVADVGDPGPLTRDEFSTVILDGSASRDPENDPLTYQWRQTAGPHVQINNAGQEVANFTAPAVGFGGQDLGFELSVSDSQYTVAAGVTIHVQDINDPPTCGDAVPSVNILWPANHKMVVVSVQNLTDPDNNSVHINIAGVTQDEPIEGTGDGDTAPDAVISSTNPQIQTVLLRAERNGNGNGRVYVVHFIADDGQESCSGAISVAVPHSRKGVAVDDGQQYDSTQP